MNTWNDAIYLIEQGYTLPQLKEMGDNEGAIVARNIKLLLNNGAVMVEPAKVQMNYQHLKPNTKEENYKNRLEHFTKAMYMTPKFTIDNDYHNDYYRLTNVKNMLADKNMGIGFDKMSIASTHRWWVTLKPYFVVRKSGGKIFFRLKDDNTTPSLCIPSALHSNDPRGNSDEEVEAYNRRYNARIEEEQNDFRKSMMLQEKEQTKQRPKQNMFQCEGITTHGKRCPVQVFHHNIPLNDKDTLERLEKSKHRLHVNCDKTKNLCWMHCDCNYCGVKCKTAQQGKLYALTHDEPIPKPAPTPKPKSNLNYYVWLCKGHRFNNKRSMGNCGHHNIRSSKHVLGKEDMASVCKGCGRTKWLSEHSLNILKCNNLKHAQEIQRALNDIHQSSNPLN